jgi:ligand-binding sensor domain-containing protein
MSDGRITRWVGDRDRITARPEAEVLEPEPAHIGWASFVSQRSVRAIAVAPRSGHLWLATWGGVLSWNRREEFVYRRYSSEHGMAGNAAACICVDQAERPWVGHIEGGLSFFDGHRWQVYADLQNVPIRAVCSAQAEGIWAAGSDSVYMIRGPDQAPELVAQEHDGAVNALALLADDSDLLLGNMWGLFCLRIGQEPKLVAEDKIHTCVALARDTSGRIWIGTQEELFCLEQGGVAGPYPLGELRPNGHILSLAAGRRRVWVLTARELAYVENDEWHSVPWPSEDEAKPAPRSIAVSADDTYLWVGTDQLLAGVWSVGKESYWDLNLLPAHQEDVLNNLGRCILAHQDDHRVWIGTASGLVAFQTNDEWFLHSNVGDVRALAASGSLWLLAWPQGIGCAIGPETLDFRGSPPPGLPTALAVSQDGRLHAITRNALWRLDADWMPISSIVPATARCLAQTPDGTWWLGTTQGAYRLIAATGTWELAGEQPGPLLSEFYMLAIVQDVLWAATDIGLWARQGNEWIAHGEARSVWALAAADNSGAIWLAREDGILRYNPATRAIEQGPYTPINSGLASRRVVALVESAGLLWIVTQAGISRFELS